MWGDRIPDCTLRVCECIFKDAMVLLKYFPYMGLGMKYIYSFWLGFNLGSKKEYCVKQIRLEIPQTKAELIEEVSRSLKCNSKSN